MPMNVSSNAGASQTSQKIYLARQGSITIGETAVSSTKSTGSLGSQSSMAWAERPELTLDGEIQRLEEEDSPQQILENRFNLACGCVIALNAVVIALETDLKPVDSAPLEERIVWILLESSFCCLFIAEIVIRVRWDGLIWLRHWSNAMDTVLVAFMVLDTWIMPLVANGVKGFQLLPILRLLRLVRLLRLLRIVKFCRGFYAMAVAFLNALKSMLWVNMMLVGGLFLTSLFTTNMIGKDDELKNVDMGGWSGEERFGTVVRSMYTLFELMTLEGWVHVGRPIVEKQPFMFLFLFAFIMVFTFGLVNMIVAMVVGATLAEAKKLEELGESEAKLKMAKELRGMRDVFLGADKDNDGLITLEEFETAMLNEPEIRNGFKALGIPAYDARELFRILDTDGSGVLKVSEFIDGCAKIKSTQVTNWDTIATYAGVRSLLHRFDPARPDLSRDPSKESVGATSIVVQPQAKGCEHCKESTEPTCIAVHPQANGRESSNLTGTTSIIVQPQTSGYSSEETHLSGSIVGEASVQTEILRRLDQLSRQNEQAAAQQAELRQLLLRSTSLPKDNGDSSAGH